MNVLRRAVRWTLMVVGCSLAIMLVLAAVLQTKSCSKRAELRAGVVDRLRPLDSYQAVQDAGLGLGVLLGAAGDHWIAIGYNDSHINMITAIAIARSSDGLWYESDRHFCGGLAGYRSNKKTLAWVTQVAADGDLDSARKMAEIYINLQPDEPLPDLDELNRRYFELGDSDLDRTLWKLDIEEDPDEQHRLLKDLGFRRIAPP